MTDHEFGANGPVYKGPAARQSSCHQPFVCRSYFCPAIASPSAKATTCAGPILILKPTEDLRHRRPSEKRTLQPAELLCFTMACSKAMFHI